MFDEYWHQSNETYSDNWEETVSIKRTCPIKSYMNSQKEDSQLETITNEESSFLRIITEKFLEETANIQRQQGTKLR